MQPFWKRGIGRGRAYTTIWQRAYDKFAEVLVFKASPGQPRYFNNSGQAIATVSVGTVAAADLAAGIQEDYDVSTPVFTDFTAELGSAAGGDVDFFPTGAGDNDAFYFGDVAPFTLSVDVTATGGAGTYTTTWEYWNGSAWTAVTGLTDGTSDLKTAGVNTVVYDLANDWDRTTVNGQGPYFYVRVRRDAGTVTADPTGDEATSTLSTVPHAYTVPNFHGAAHAGHIVAWWLADGVGTTVSFEVYARTDSVVNIIETVGTVETVEFTGEYVLVATVTALADHAESKVEVGYRPIFVRPTTTDAGTLRLGAT